MSYNEFHSSGAPASHASTFDVEGSLDATAALTTISVHRVQGIPEPASIALIGVAFVGAVGLCMRRFEREK